MKYTLEFSDLAIKQLKKLKKENKYLQERIVLQLKKCQVEPERHTKKLKGLPYYRMRVGDYRIILSIQQGKLRILVIKLGHRRDIYK